MNRISSFLPFLLFGLLLLSSCRQEPKEKSTVEFKRTENSAIIQQIAEPDRLNPVLSTSGYASVIYAQIFPFLLNTDPNSLELAPVLVKERPAVEEITSGPLAGGVAYTFEIREEAVWDDGSPVTANDYIFTLKASLHPKIPAPRVRPYLAFIKDVRVDENNPKKFTVFTNEKYILGEEAISLAVPVLPEYIFDPAGKLKAIDLTTFTDPEKIAQLADNDQRLQQFADEFSQPQYSRDPAILKGCGPYELASWESGQQVVLKKKQNWWGEKLVKRFPILAAYPDELIFKPIPNEATTVAAIKAEELDVISELAPPAFEEVRQLNFVTDRYDFHTPQVWAYYYLAVNTRVPKLADKRVRQALAHAINVDEILQNVFQGYGERIANPIHPTYDYYNDQLPPIPFDIQKAKDLLREAGWEDSNNDGTVDKMIDGIRTELVLSYLYTAGRELSQNIGLLIQDNASQAGIGIELTPKENTVALDDLRNRRFELISSGRSLSGLLWDPKQNWHSEGDNRTGFGNAETDALIDEIRVTLDKKKRDEQYKKLQEIMYDEQAEILLIAPKGRLVVHKRFQTPVSPVFPGFSPNLLKME